MENHFMEKADYEEPRCPCEKPTDRPVIPIDRIIKKLDEYLNKKDMSSAERHLRYWLDEAEAINDIRGKLSILNEQIGLYRKECIQEKCMCAINESNKIINDLDIGDTVTAGTTYINIATAYKSFGQAETALEFYKKAKEIYEKQLSTGDSRFGGLYNNMALALAECGLLEDAKILYENALLIMRNTEHGEAEMAITYCNLADLTAMQQGIVDGEKQINSYLQKAEELLNCKSLPQNGYYAFICEKCAPTFDYYGLFMTAQELRKRAERIYAGN